MNSDTKPEVLLLKAIKSGGHYREEALARIYRNPSLKLKVVRHVQKWGGNIQDGEDMFQEAIIVLDRNVRENKFREESSIDAYLFSIGKFLWKNRMRKTKKTVHTDEDYLVDKTVMDDPEVELISQERKEILLKLMSQLGDRCQEVLKLWQLSYSMNEIAEIVGLSSDTMARKTKYRCMQKLLELVDEQTGLKELLK